MNGWVTVWDVAREPFMWGNAGEGLAALAIVALGTAGAFAARRRREGMVSASILAAAVALAGYFVWRTLQHDRDHAACVEALRSGAGAVLEGPVRDFRPLTSVWQRPAYESFTVAGEEVRLPLLAEGCGYHRTVVEGGPFREGLRVRLRRWKGQILQLEVAMDSAASPTAAQAR